MKPRLLLKVVGVLALVGISIVALMVVLLLGWFFLAAIIPNRMNVTGRVTDSTGRPIRDAKVHAVPLDAGIPGLGNSMEPQGRAKIVFTDENGQFLLDRLIASGGVKEGMWLQEYDISIKADGYSPAHKRLRNNCDNHEDLITLGDILLEKEKPDIVSPKAPGFMPGVHNSISFPKHRHLPAPSAVEGSEAEGIH